MDLLKQELLKKRQSLQSDFGGKKLLKRSEIEQKKLQKIRHEEQRSLQSKKPLPQPTPPNPKSDSQSANPNHPPSSSSESSLPPALQSKRKPPETLTEEQKIDDLNLPKQEVIRRLRFLKQPITLFGEDDDARLDRLKLTLKSGVLEIDSDMTEGQTNDFLRDIYELQKRQKSGSMNERKKGKREGDDGGDDDKDDGGEDGVEDDRDGKRMKARFEDLCDEDKILVFFKRLLNEWGQELEETAEAEKRTAAGKSMVAKFKQCERYLHPLFKFCRKKVIFFIMQYFYVMKLGLLWALWLLHYSNWELLMNY